MARNIKSKRLHHFIYHSEISPNWIPPCCSFEILLPYNSSYLNDKLPFLITKVWLVVPTYTDSHDVQSVIRKHSDKLKGVFIAVELDRFQRAYVQTSVATVISTCKQLSLSIGMYVEQKDHYVYVETPRYTPVHNATFDYFIISVPFLNLYHHTNYIYKYLQRCGILSTKILVPFYHTCIFNAEEYNIAGFVYGEYPGTENIHYCSAMRQLGR